MGLSQLHQSCRGVALTALHQVPALQRFELVIPAPGSPTRTLLVQHGPFQVVEGVGRHRGGGAIIVPNCSDGRAGA